MLIGQEHFRKLYKTPIIVKDKQTSHEIARSLLIDTIWEDDLSGEELSEKIASIEIDDDINSLLVIAYIDHTQECHFTCLQPHQLPAVM